MAEAGLLGLATDLLKSLTTDMLLCGAKDELRSLEDTVKTIQAVLLDAEKQQRHNHQFKDLLKRLKDVLYDIQDLPDVVAIEYLRRKVTSGNKTSKEVHVFFFESNQLAHYFKVATKIQEFRKKLVRNKNDRKFHLETFLVRQLLLLAGGGQLII
ncbi:hypothetical protein ACJRO7_031759 [Eucalyptus globulus]|uniref:Disease resistance N-terminal domain-containing protein n=1 Tax=Eucalyptus globulus TaxID=34317 RepID=A0ABD3JM44_EUCGL